MKNDKTMRLVAIVITVLLGMFNAKALPVDNVKLAEDYTGCTAKVSGNVVKLGKCVVKISDLHLEDDDLHSDTKVMLDRCK